MTLSARRKASTDTRAAGAARARADAIARAVIEAPRQRDDFDAVVAREVKRLQESARRRRLHAVA